MRLKDSATAFGVISILMHWYVAIVVFFFLITGFTTEFIGPHGALRPFREDLTWWHMSIGVTSIPIFLYRTFWRLHYGEPKTAEQHWALELSSNIVWRFILVIIIWQIFTGAGYELTHGNPVHWFGLVLIEPGQPTWILPLTDYFLRAHNWPSYIMMGLLLLHIGGALKHHFIDRDQVLRKILWPSQVPGNWENE